MENNKKELTFFEATSIIVGHGVGSGILSVPFLAGRNSIRDFVIIIVVAYLVNLIMHFMIAELSYNNNGAQFITCFEKELFVGKFKKVASWIAFAILGFSVIVNISGFIVGASAVFNAWFGLPGWVGMIIYYVAASLVVNFGLKLVGICEKISVISLVLVIGILAVATILSGGKELHMEFVAFTNVMALYSMVSFSLSAVMSVPQVVKGLSGKTGRIKGAIVVGTGINLGLVLIITIITMLGAGSNISKNGALVDLAAALGGWVSIVGYVFSLLALSTSFWANSLNIRDIVNEQTKWGERKSFVASSLPCLVLALLGFSSFVGFTRMASVVQVLTGIGIIIAYNRSRRASGQSLICGKLGTLAFQIIVVISSIVATVGAILPIK